MVVEETVSSQDSQGGSRFTKRQGFLKMVAGREVIEGEALVLLSTRRQHRAGEGWHMPTTTFLGAQCLQEGKWGGKQP